jgi:ribosomal protein S18 acetylase RimI-like enzyme
MNLSTHSVSSDQVQNLISFSKSYPWKPAWPEDLVQLFLTQYISSPALVFDMHDGSERIAIGVLLDKVQNPGNFANLEILGMLPRLEPTLVIDQIISLAKNRIPISHSGFQIGFHHSYEWLPSLVSKHQLSLYYETFEMQNDKISSERGSVKEFSIASPEDDHDLYAVLKESFQENVDTSIPEFTDWKAGRNQTNDSRTWLARENDQIIGFLTLIPKKSKNNAEIRTVGILPRMRGKGIGKELIKTALQHLYTIGIRSCELTVALQNKNALNLYRKLGFTEVDHYVVYKWCRC